MPFLDYDGDATELLETYGTLNLLTLVDPIQVFIFPDFLMKYIIIGILVSPVPDNLINCFLQEMPEAENHAYYTTSHTMPVSLR